MHKIAFNWRIKVLIFILIVSISAGILVINSVSLNNTESNKKVIPTNCTIFTVSDESNVYFGNSEDGGENRKYAEIWFSPARNDQTYGCAFLGFNGNESGGINVGNIGIGGINTEGLCFDANEILPASLVNYSPEQGLLSTYLWCWEDILRECSSVSEVIKWYQTHNMGGWWETQIHWADKTGDAVIVSPTPDHKIAFTRKTGDFLVSTNFNPVDHSQGWYPCQRYELVTSRLERISTGKNIDRKDLIPILYAVSSPKTVNYIGTAYSNIFELKSQTIYFYIQRDFDHELIYNLNEELKKGSHTFKISSETNMLSFTPYWELIFPTIFTICIIGIGSSLHSIYKKSFQRISKRKTKQ